MDGSPCLHDAACRVDGATSQFAIPHALWPLGCAARLALVSPRFLVHLDWHRYSAKQLGLFCAAVAQSNTTLVQLVALLIGIVSSLVYLFTVHLASWLLLERLGEKMPSPPLWVQRLLET